MGLRRPDGGAVRVLGLDPQKDGRALRQRIGIQLQEAALFGRLKVWEALDLFSTFYANTIPWEPLLEQWGLDEKRDTVFDKLSGGQKQRLFIALALLNDPIVVFLDELTTGLDPQARHNTWDLLRTIRKQGKTVVLVTHFMDEAEELCDRVAIIDHGRLVALDTPSNLIRNLGGESRVAFEVNGRFSAEVLRDQPAVTRLDQNGGQVTVYGPGDGLVSAVVNNLEAQHTHFQNLRTEQPDLEDAFIALTGRRMRDFTTVHILTERRA